MKTIKVKTKEELKEIIGKMAYPMKYSSEQLDKIVKEHLDRNPFVKENLGKEVKVFHIYPDNGDALIKKETGYCLEFFEYNL